MGKPKYCSYENARANLYNKDVFVNNYIEQMFNRCQRMFEWKNLPDSIPQKELEFILQKNGNAFIAEHKGNLYAFSGGLGGVPDEYCEPTLYTVANPYLELNKSYRIGVDGVLVRNDSRMLGLLPIFSKSAVMNCDCEITLNMLATLLRVQFMITASDDKSRQQADLFVTKIKNGDFSAVSSSQFSDGIKLFNGDSNSQAISQFIQLSQYVRATAFNEIGLNANFNMKKERLISTEINVNESALLPMVENMLQERKGACEKINAMFGTSIDVELACVWKEQAETHETDIIGINSEITGGPNDDVEIFESGDNTSEIDNDTENQDDSRIIADSKIKENSEEVIK